MVKASKGDESNCTPVPLGHETHEQHTQWLADLQTTDPARWHRIHELGTTDRKRWAEMFGHSE